MTDKYLKYRKIRIYPNDEEKQYFDYCIGASRFIYNWALDIENDQYEKYINGQSDKQFVHDKELRVLYKDLVKKEPWLKNMQIETVRSIIHQIDNAFKMFFMHLCEHPTYKTKKSQHRKSHYSYRLRNDRFYIDGSNIRIPGFKRGKMISCKYNTGLYKKDNIIYHQVDLIRDNLGNYSVGFYTIENKPLEYINSIPESKAIGIDINIRKDRRYVCSDGTIFKGRDLSSKIKNIDNLNSRIDKMEKANPNIKPSKRLEKLILRRRKVYNKIHNINEYEVQYYSKQVINKHPKTVVMEDISIREITSKNKFIAKAAHFVNLYRFTEVMRYKCNQYNIPFIQADRNFKSSQICSCCGSIQPMPMHKKVYNCPICNLKIDRDLNAAINLSKLA